MMKIRLLGVLLALCAFFAGPVLAEEIALYWDSGKVKKRAEGEIDLQGAKQGRWTYWFANGQKEKEGNYLNGRENDRWVYYFADRTKRMEGRFLEGKREGVWTYWRGDGEKAMEISFKNGEEHGFQKVWNPDCSFLGQIKFRNGIRCGLYQEKDGMLQEISER